MHLKLHTQKSRIGGLLIDLKVEIKLETKHSPLNKNKKTLFLKIDSYLTTMPINM